MSALNLRSTYIARARVELARATYYTGAARALHGAAAKGYMELAKRIAA